LIVGHVGCQLSEQFLSRPCDVSMSAMRLLVPATSLYTYPDVAAVCDAPKFQDESYKGTLLNPTVIVEVLTKSSEEYDRGPKFEQYRSPGSLAEYLLFSSWRGRRRIIHAPARWPLAAHRQIQPGRFAPHAVD
jgi:Uma2 family endonuclease